jgi:hypothetical protein
MDVLNKKRKRIWHPVVIQPEVKTKDFHSLETDDFDHPGKKNPLEFVVAWQMPKD